MAGAGAVPNSGKQRLNNGHPDKPLSRTKLPDAIANIEGTVSRDATAALALLTACPVYQPTACASHAMLAKQIGIGELWVKDERTRMGLGSFKALGAAYVIAAKAVSAQGGSLDKAALSSALSGQSFVAASAGNHGLSVAAGARIFGARAVIYLSDAVPAGFADLLRSKGADVVVEGTDYAASMQAAARAAETNGWVLLSDSTWPGYSTGREVVEGYLALAAEIVSVLAQNRPTHVFLQAGVGGLAAAITAHLRDLWGDGPQIIVVEPTDAPALIGSIRAGKSVFVDGPASTMGRLDCKEPSLLALKCLAAEADVFMTLTDAEVGDCIALLPEHDLDTSASGGAGLAGLMRAATQGALGLGADSRAVVILSEGPV